MPAKTSKAAGRAAADILTRFAFITSMEEFWTAYQEVYQLYDLCDDPFTRLPCCAEDYAKSCIEYERQIMLEKYGHCDGL